jgi:hypothetical protein
MFNHKNKLCGMTLKTKTDYKQHKIVMTYAQSNTNMWKDLFPVVWEALRQLLLFMQARMALTTANGSVEMNQHPHSCFVSDIVLPSM